MAGMDVFFVSIWIKYVYVVVVQEACWLVTVLLHLFFLSSFCWMLVEGLLLWSKVVSVNISEERRMKLYYVLGWGVCVCVCKSLWFMFCLINLPLMYCVCICFVFLRAASCYSRCNLGSHFGSVQSTAVLLAEPSVARYLGFCRACALCFGRKYVTSA